MSAFICSDKHINTIVTWGSQYKVSAYHGVPGRTYEINGNEQEVAKELLTENTKSVNYRYSENDPVDPIKYRIENTVSPIEAYKLCQSLSYQSCEHPEWETSFAKAYVDAIQDETIRRIPGYEFAKWSL